MTDSENCNSSALLRGQRPHQVRLFNCDHHPGVAMPGHRGPAVSRDPLACSVVLPAADLTNPTDANSGATFRGGHQWTTAGADTGARYWFRLSCSGADGLVLCSDSWHTGCAGLDTPSVRRKIADVQVFTGASFGLCCHSIPTSRRSLL